jgi:hypothetical protein
MGRKFDLIRTKQCDKCPWKVTTDPNDIPNNYCELKHAALSITISDGMFNINQKTMHVMACHHSDGEDNMYCVGWLHNQLGVGNNIMLRIKMMDCNNIGKLKIVGEQHEYFEDTLPHNKQ